MRLQDRTYLFILNSLFNFLYIEEKKKLYNGEFYYSLNNENNTLSQIYSVSKSISLLGDRYDCVILSRYDNFIYNFPNLNDLSKSYAIDSSGNITTPEIIDLSYPRYLYISIEGINTNNRSNLPDSSFKNMFAKIPISSNFGELINYEPTQMSPQNVPNMHVQSLTVRILDEYGEAVDFNNGFWSLSLSIQWAMDIGSAGMEDITMGRTHRPVYFNGGHDPLKTYPKFIRNLKRKRF